MMSGAMTHRDASAMIQSITRSMSQMIKTVITSVITDSAETRMSAKTMRPPVVMFLCKIEELIFTW